MRLRYALLVGVAVAVLLVDQLVKAVVTTHLANSRFVDVLGGWVRLDDTHNSGTAFGFYQGRGVLLAAIAVAICAGIVVYYRRLARSPLPIRLSLGLILGGAVGNLLDRVRLGYVVDFIDLRWWPVFNLADSAIVVGVVVLIGQSVLRPGELQHST